MDYIYLVLEVQKKWQANIKIWQAKNKLAIMFHNVKVLHGKYHFHFVKDSRNVVILTEVARAGQLRAV